MYRTFFRKVLWLGALLLLLLPVGVMAEPLDEIEEEIIYLKTREDGSLDIQYHIEWEVLDSTSEGPLNWVKIGIPNAYVEDMKALSDSIENIRYYGSDGDYVRLDLDRDYEAGEVVESAIFLSISIECTGKRTGRMCMDLHRAGLTRWKFESWQYSGRKIPT